MFTPSESTLAEYGPRACPFDMPEISGLYIGGCVASDGGRFRRQAHAHNMSRDKHFGWVCILSHRRIFGQTRTAGLWVPNDRPSQLMLHEYAHILAPNHGHDEVWMLAAHKLGYRFPKYYKSLQPWPKFQANQRRESTAA